MGGVAFSDDPNEVQIDAGVTMHVPGAWDAIAAGVLPWGLFPKAGATLPVRVGWHVAGEALRSSQRFDHRIVDCRGKRSMFRSARAIGDG